MRGKHILKAKYHTERVRERQTERNLSQLCFADGTYPYLLSFSLEDEGLDFELQVQEHITTQPDFQIK